MRFFLGTHMANWLADVDVPLFVSHRRLRDRRTLPRARAPWALDSGGFTELSMYGEWRTTPAEYAHAVQRYSDEIGGLVWAAPQDSMCEPWITAKTGRTVLQHQHDTVTNLLELRSLAPDLPFAPVLQGWERDDYHRCADLYETAGIDLANEPVVGVGSVCRRQATGEIADLFASLRPLRLHGFGVKAAGLRQAWPHLTSADSMAWSYRARHDRPLRGCTHKSCANCPRYALAWRSRILAGLSQYQPQLWEVPA